MSSNISFRVNRGETLAVIGATGSGKTTLVSLIPRFYDATEGEVLVDGVNVRDYTFDTLYNKLGYVTQKAVLFAGSIRDNVYFGESEAPADDEALAQAVELSQAKEFVDKLPDGTQHHVAQMGRNMSGGQKQRLSIARRAGAKAGDPRLRRSRSPLWTTARMPKLREGLVQAAARHDEDHRRAAHQHHPPRRQDHRARPRRGRGHRHARRADAQLRRLPRDRDSPSSARRSSQ
ncbi:MAG: ATP-binding cassette domain-containing protein [Oscillibacter sp.]